MPRLDSGSVYLRDPFYLYLQTAIIRIFGWSAFWLRVPSVLFGVATIVASSRLARDLFDRKTALLTAAILTFSVWGIELSRYARPYSAFQFMFLVALYFFLRGFIRRETAYRYAFLVAALIALATHSFGLLLLLFFLIPLPLASLQPRDKWGLAVWAASLLGLRYLYSALVQYFSSSNEGQVTPLAQASVPDPSLIDRIWSIARLPALSGPDLAFLAQAAAQRRLLATGLIALTAVASAYAIHQLVRSKELIKAATLVPMLWAALLHQFGVFLLLLASHVILFPRQPRGQGRSPLSWICVLGIGTFLTWFGAMMADADLTLKQAVRLLLGFPDLNRLMLHWLVRGWPILTIVVGVGLVLLLRRFLSDRSDAMPLLLIGGVFLPAIFASSVRFYFESRYFFHLYPLLVMIFAMIAVRLQAHAMKHLSHRPLWTRRLATISIMVGALFASQDANPLGAWDVGDRTYTTPKDPIRSVLSWDLYADFHQDHESPSRHVKARLEPGDLVVSFGPMYMAANYQFYVGKVDFVVVPAGLPNYYAVPRHGQFVNYITSSVNLAGLKGLQQTVQEAIGAVWILADRKLVAPENDFYSEELKDTLRALMLRPDFVGRDGQTFARKINAWEDLPQ